MSPRTTVAAGLASGITVAVAVILAAIAFLPEPGIEPTGSALPSGSGGLAASASTGPDGSGASGEPTGPVASGDVPFHVGEAAPALVLPQLGGGEINLANLDGQAVWVNFMQTICPPCVDEFPLMSGFAARYADAGLVVLAIDIREDEGTVAAFAQSLNATFPIGLDADGTAQAAWDAAALPVHFWVDRDGIIRAGALGGIGPDIMAQNLQTILPGVDVTP